MSFSDPRWLWVLWALPVMALFEWWAALRVRRRLRALIGERANHPLLEGRLGHERLAGAVLRVSALACLILGASGPEWGREVVRRGSTGSDVVLLLDASASMDTRDVPPSRMAEARREALAVLDRLAGSRVGVVAFAGDAVRLCPLTLDVPAARLVLEAMSSGALSTPGTDLGKGLRMALKVMPQGRREEQAIVVWTDGEDLEHGGKAAIEEVARSGIRVFAVGLGTSEGDVVPVLDASGSLTDVKRDEKGNTVRSRLDEGLLRALAQRTHGAYFSASRPGGELGRLLGAIENLARSSRRQRLVERPVPRFPLFAAVAALLLAYERVRRKRRRERASESIELHRGRRAVAAVVTGLVILAPGDARAQTAWARGDRAFALGRFAAAESLYTQRLKRGAPDAVRVNRATTMGLAGRTAAAERELERLAGGVGPPGDAARYNVGTLKAERRDDEAALAALRRALETNPNDADARWNYEVVARRIDAQRRKDDSQQPKPNSGGGGGQQPQPSQPQPQQQQPQASQTAPSPPQPGPPSQPQKSQGAGMTREQADRLLNALQDLARAEQQKKQPVRAVNEKRGRDW